MIIKSFFSGFWSLIVFARFPLLVLAFFWLFTANVYADCYSRTSIVNNNYPCENGSIRPNYVNQVNNQCQTIENALAAGTWSNCTNAFCVITQCPKCSGDYFGASADVAYILCTSQAELDSIRCQVNPDDPNCEDRCSVYHQQCEQLGGVFTGRQTPTGCAASCNTCGTTASKNILEIKIESCCNQGLAPSVERMCITPDIATGDGMQVSSNANLECVDPNLDDDNLKLYVQYCEDNPPGSSDSNQSSGSGDGSSSSGESSSSSDDNNSSASGAGDTYNYYPILDTIRDSLVNIRKNVQNIYTCMITPGTCTGLTPQVTVNVPSDSSFLKNINSSINTTNTLLDSSLRNGNERLRNSIASANDTLIDSLRKFLGGLSKGFSGDTLGDSLGRLHRTLEEFKAMFEAGEIDTSGLGAEWGGYLHQGELMGDSIVSNLGWGDIDTIEIDSIYSRALNGSNIDSVSGVIDDSLGVLSGKLSDSLSRRNDSLKNALPGILDSLADSLVIWAPFADFDSIIYSTIGAHVPNRSDCPEDCQKWTVSIPVIGLYNYTVDFGMCLGRASFGGLSVLGFLKLLIRVLVAYMCIMTSYKVLVRMI